MLAPFTVDKREFKENFEYLVSYHLAKKLIEEGKAELCPLEKKIYQNKMLKINYERV